eukprot:13216524-Alexandrium_andersonii.AAC.1
MCIRDSATSPEGPARPKRPAETDRPDMRPSTSRAVATFARRVRSAGPKTARPRRQRRAVGNQPGV